MKKDDGRPLPRNQFDWADIFSAGAFRRLSSEGGMSVMPAPITRVHDPSDVATHGEALASAGQSAFRSERLVMCLRLIPLARRPRRRASDGPVRASYL